MDQESAAMFNAASRVGLLAFEDAQVVPGIVPGTYFLIVRGQAPCLNMTVSLAPRVYVTCPDYWAIEVVGTLIGDICLDTVRPYVEVIGLSGTTGYRGIKVVGANRSEQFEVAGGCRDPDV